MALPSLIDSCFWIALFDSRDQYHVRAVELWELIEEENFLVPWPTLYETLATRMIRRPDRVEALVALLKSDAVILHDDTSYREKALQSLIDFEMPPCSLTDKVIRRVLEDRRLNLQALITFNRRDFEDVCQERNIPIIP